MIRRLILAGCISLCTESAFAESVQIQLSGEADSEGTSGTQSVETAAATSDAEAAAQTSAPAAAEVATKMPEGFSGKLEYGHVLYMKGDHQGALVAYTAAKEMKPGDPLPLYFIACAQAKRTQYDEALSTLAALRTVCGDKLASLNVRGLFLAAVIEEMRGNWDNARLAWTVYKEFVSSHAGIPSFAATADARMQAFEKKRALDEQYKAVRMRIAGSE